MEKAFEIFQRHAEDKGLHHSNKRDFVVRKFLRIKSHVSAQELYDVVHKERPGVGYTTVYRALKLTVESGIAEVVDFNDGVRRFEPKLGREYHAHFICTKCGRDFEIFDNNIKKLSMTLSRKKGFSPQKQRFEIFGFCRHCC